MKDILKITVVLLIICIIAGGVLAFVYKKTAPKIAENKKLEEENARKEVLPKAEYFESVSDNGKIFYYKGFNENQNLVGFAFQCEKEGYSSTIQTMVGIDTLFQITGIKIVSQQETPGLGAKVSKLEFTEQFKSKNPEKILADKDGGKIESITGATISTRTITNSIREKFKNIKEKLSPEQGVK
ncbi:MAG: RnfABCDGE type electron transport complex subunit G [Candidatus Cloacimonetes bacterium]|nr:RnfABCDGE type electron transport complex subunit G [Candidatus Cloacimonadota bacterium]MBL7108569.1 RnfABCDGE type electron transport complex subunit G [Candidatus Cloacimonadota bacterium]